MSAVEFNDCVALLGPELRPRLCRRVVIEAGIFAEIDAGRELLAMDRPRLVLIPGLVNGHTHVGDALLPDGATGLTVEEGFFRPDGFKYRELDKASPEDHFQCLSETLEYMARCGTVGHIDFREQGIDGARRLREASRATGVQSVILSQLRESPFNAEALTLNAADLPLHARSEVEGLLELADGISESTVNDLTDPAWNGLREQTQLRGKLRAIHCLESLSYREESFRVTGKGDLRRALAQFDPDLVVHMTVANEEEIHLLQESGKAAVINPRANASLGLPFPPIRELMDAGIPLLLGTDNVMLNSPNLFAEMDFTYRVLKSQYGDPRLPDPVEILRMVTINAAQFMGKGYSGVISERAPATMTALDFRQPHLCRSRHIPASIVGRVSCSDVVMTIREGRILFKAQT